MALINVLIASPLGEECLGQIRRVGPGMKITDASELFRTEGYGDSAAKLSVDSLLRKAEIIYGFRFPQDILSRAPKLKWLQVTSAGVNWFLDNITDLRESPVLLTNASGIHAIPISEFVLGLMLMFAKQAPLSFRLHQEKQWKQYTTTLLHSKTVGIVGLGSIGREVARLTKALGMQVIATRRSAKGSTRARYVDIVLPREQLRELLSQSDYVVLTLPLTPETEKLIGETELRAMKPTACLINIARGGIIDERVLIRSLKEQWIAGAGLDVFATEPLPAHSELWELPNVILSPHLAGHMEEYNVRATEIFSENLRRYLDGRKLINVVDKKRGY